MHLLPAAGRPAQPWKNGRGKTWPVAASPAGADLERFDWRVSIAEIVEDGPFSAFPGVDRSIAVIDGAGITLMIDGQQRQLAPFEVHTFSGDAATSCRLSDGPTRDLNLMTARASIRGSIEVVTVTGELRIDARLVLVLRGRAQIADDSGVASLAEHDAALHDAPAVLRADRALVAVVRVVRNGPQGR